MRTAGDPLPIDWFPILRAFDDQPTPDMPADRSLPEPTVTMPGSDQKRSVLAARARAKFALWHPADPTITCRQLVELHERLLVDREVQKNGRAVEPDLHAESVARSTRFELNIKLKADSPKVMIDFWLARGRQLGNSSTPPCPRCGWRHRDGRHCSWCRLDLERSAALEHARRQREDAEDAVTFITLQQIEDAAEEDDE